MRIAAFAFLAPLVYVLALCVPADAADESLRPIEMTQGQVTIVGALLGADGYLTADMHRVFWEDVSDYAVDAAGGEDAYTRHLEADLLRRVALMHEMWRSAALSWSAGEDVETPEFTVALERHRALAAASNRLARLGARQDVAAMTQLILMAASSGEMVRDGDEPMIAHANIEAGIAARPGAAGRVHVLARRTWQPEESPHQYEIAGVTIQSAWPFTVRVSDSDMDGANEAVRLTKKLDRVSAIEVQRVAVNIVGGLSEALAALAAKRAIGATSFDDDADQFRGHRSTLMTGTREIENGTLAVAVRAILLDPGGDILLLIAEAGRGDSSQARARLEALEEALTINR